MTTRYYHQIEATYTGPQTEIEEIFYIIEHLPNPAQATLAEVGQTLSECLKRAEPGAWLLTLDRLAELWPEVEVVCQL